MNIKLTILCVFICQLNGYLSGQVEQCGTDYQNSELIYNDIDYLNKRKEIEKFTKQILAKNGSKEFIITDEIITIPVVFHVVYKKLEQNIDDSYLIEQIQILNEDFRRTNFDAINTPIDFADIAADCKIEFCLASTDPSGNPTNGITRTLSTIPIWYYIDVTPDIPNYANKVKSGLTGGTDPWPTDSYLNIWICNLEPGLLGYAQFPGGPTETDGVVIDYEYIGNNPAGAPHDLGRVATHEIGHWLNLYHIWGQSEDAVTGGCGIFIANSDECGDTPQQDKASIGCPVFPFTDDCTESSPGVMFMDYMDYSYNSCKNMFTSDQKDRMRALFEPGGARYSIMTSTGCTNPTCDDIEIAWQNTIGGSADDNITSIQQTSDGGYILGGYSNSGISGDKTESNLGSLDYWVIKTDNNGIIQWQNTIGGSAADYIYSIQQTSDGGYIVGGTSNSGVSGDKTENCISGSNDYWVVKLNSTGGITWQNTIGGNFNDYLRSIEQTSDGGYILAGHSNSGISGDKTEASLGTDDYWVVKLNSSGTIVWQNTLGGSSAEYAYKIKQTLDGGYFVAGISYSGISGDKTEANMGVNGDYWVLKLNSTGGIQWQNTIGGAAQDYLYSFGLTNDNGYILGGTSESGISGDKTEPNLGSGDYWVVKLNSLGNIEWQNTFGGILTDEAYSIQQLTDGNYFIAGHSFSNSSLDKCADNESGVTLTPDMWTLLIDNTGDIISQSTFGGSQGDYISEAQQTFDNGFILAGSSTSTISGDKTELNLGGNDIWLIKLAGTGCEGPMPASFNIQWQNTIGGTGDDLINSVENTSDGGYILGGTSTSGISLDKSQTGFGGEDYWVVKVNECGEKEWDKTFGGISGDNLTDLKQTFDGGYIVGGYSSSGISGNKTESLIGGNDYWILKLNSDGSIAWQNSIGGTGADELQSISQTSDGGYILAGESSSNVSGDKTEICYGGKDYWIIKLDGSGNISWQNTIAGSSYEWIGNISQTSDGGYIVIGSSASGVSADKTEPNLDVAGGLTHYDMWIIKLNSTGAISWQNTIGGDHNDWALKGEQTDDGGYTIYGFSQSPISDDITENPIGGSGNADYFLIKLDDSGNILWQNMIGSSNHDYGRCGQTTIDGGFIITGESYSSGISGDKTINNFDAINGDIWTTKTNSLGTVTNQFVLGGSNIETINTMTQTEDGGYLLGITSTSPISGNKTEPSSGYDFWFVKMFGCVPALETCNGIDDDCDGFVDDGIVITASITAGGPTTFCQGGSVLLTATYSGESIQWKKDGVNIVGATSSTYNVTAKATYTCTTTSLCGTATSDGIFINVNKNPTASISASGSTTFCAGGSVTLTETPTAGSTYQWYKGASTIVGATLNAFVATTAGNYKCRVTKTATGCYKNSNVISVSVPCKVGEMENEIMIYPNPTNGIVNISFNPLQYAGILSVKDITGKDIFKTQIEIGLSDVEINLSDYSKGLYLVTIIQNENQFTAKLIKD